MLLYLIRHGQSHINLDTWESLTNLDAGLTEKGQRQAAALRDWLKVNAEPGNALYSSTMLRARETSVHVSEALGLKVTFDDRLRELSSNHASGLPVDAVKLPRTFNSEWADIAPFSATTSEFDDAESWMHLRVRLAQFVDTLAKEHPEDVIYVIAHGGVIGAMFDNVFNVGPYRRCEVSSMNTSWTLFEHIAGRGRPPWSLRHHNRIDHLVGTDLL